MVGYIYWTCRFVILGAYYRILMTASGPIYNWRRARRYALPIALYAALVLRPALQTLDSRRHNALSRK